MSDPTRCRATGKDGAPCKNHPVKDSEFCRWHRAPKPRAVDSLNESSEGTPAVSISEPTQRLFWAIEFMKAIRGDIPDEEWAKVIQAPGLKVSVLRDGTEETYLLPWAGSAIRLESDPKRQTWVLTVGVGAIERLVCEDPWRGEENPPQQVTFFNAILDFFKAAARDGSFILSYVYGAPQGTPCLGYFFLPGDSSIIIQAHDSIPIRADGLPDLRVLTTPREEWDALDEVVVDTSSGLVKRGPGRPKQKRLAPLAENGIIRVESSRVESHVIRALSPGGLRRDIPDELVRKLGTGERWWAGTPIHSESKRAGGAEGLIGLPSEPDAALWDFLQRNGALAVKAQIALWAGVYAETNAEPGRFVSQSISEFCDALGYTRKKRAHKRENREQAIKVLKLLMELELLMFHRGTGGKTQRIRGTIWKRGLVGEELDSYADLFGAMREGSPSEWVQVGFSYAPGHWFQNQEWRAQNRSFALVGEGILKLRPDRDQAAILVGGYLATQARIGRYAPKRLKLATIAERSGLLAADPEHPGRVFDDVERALEKLEACQVVGAWKQVGAETGEPDMDDIGTLACLVNLAENRRRAVLEIVWPAAVLERAKGAKARG